MLGGREARAGVADLDPQRAVARLDRQRDRVPVVETGVADRVGHQLGDEQLRVLQPPPREVVGQVAQRPACRGGRVRVVGELDPVPHAGASGGATNVSRSRIRVTSNTRITGSGPGTRARLPPARSRLERCHHDRAQPGRVHELEPAQVEHDGARRAAVELVLERGGAREIELARERDDGRRARP